MFRIILFLLTCFISYDAVADACSAVPAGWGCIPYNGGDWVAPAGYPLPPNLSPGDPLPPPIDPINILYFLIICHLGLQFSELVGQIAQSITGAAGGAGTAQQKMKALKEQIGQQATSTVAGGANKVQELVRNKMEQRAAAKAKEKAGADESSSASSDPNPGVRADVGGGGDAASGASSAASSAASTVGGG